jgi:hypothetical protein
MGWYLQHQRAKQINAEHQREAEQIQLARLAMTGAKPLTTVGPDSCVGRSPGLSPCRSLGHSLARTLDAERRSATDGLSSDSAA